MPSSRDPRSYVKPVPLPVPSCKGVKLLARDMINFNPQTPTREVVRQNNFNRRQMQMSLMGFKSLNHKPYMGIGDPFYLDEKKMILHALGQWNEQETSSSSSGEESDDEEDKSAEKKTAFTAAKFVLRRSRKDLNTLNKAVVHGRHMIRHVKLGHGLFDLIDKEKEDKKLASEMAIQKRREMLRNEFQPPKTESDDDSGDDITSEVDLTNYMVPVAPPTFLTQHQLDIDEELGIVNDNTSDSDQSPEREPDIVTFSGLARMALAEQEEEYLRARSAAVTSEMTSALSRPVSSRKKKQQTPRPYTPQHTNLSTNISTNLSTRGSIAEEDEPVDISKDALFRQLCVLHWILEAMSTDTPSVMTPITSCWSLSDIGGSKAQPKKIQKDKATESNWTSFINKESARSPQVVAKVSKRLSSTRLSNRSPHARRNMLPGTRNSTQSSGTGSHQGSTTGLNTLTTQMNLLSARNRGDEDQLAPQEEEEDQAYNKSIFKFLDEYYESLKKEEEASRKKEDDNKSTSSDPYEVPSVEQKKEKKSKEKDEKSGKKPKKKKTNTEETKRLDHKVAVALGEEEKMSSKYLRANAHLIRPKSSPALLEFQASLPSTQKANLCVNLHNNFAESREEKALTLHDILDHKEGQRRVICHSKFASLQNLKQGSSFHRAVEDMRTQSWQLMHKPNNERKKSVVKGNWFTDLVDKIPREIQQEWYYAKILQKLGVFVSVEGTGKQSIYKFLKVLQGLREWEICSPDVSAAIEFCRERIVEMTVEEYEWWFKEQFPRVTRPQTAPPASKMEKKDEGSSTSGTVTAKPSMQRRVVQSAFARRVQR